MTHTDHPATAVRMAWIRLLGASFLEIGWAVGIKYTDGFSLPLPTALVLLGMATSFFLVSGAVRWIPIGTGYAVFAGIGAGGTGLVGILLLGEPAAVGRLLSLAAIVIGVIGLKIFSAGRPAEAQ